MVASTQSRDKLKDRRGKNNKVSTTIWKEYEVERKKGKEKRGEASNCKRGTGGKIGSRQ